jgi:WD40 repeat protein
LEPLHIIQAHKNNIYALAVAPDGKTVYTGSGDGTIKVWTIPEGKHLATLKDHERRVNALAISPDGTRLLSAGYDSTLRLWQLPEGEQIRKVRIKSVYDFGLDWDPQGRFVLVRAGRDLQLRSYPSLDLQRNFVAEQSVEAAVLGTNGALAVGAMSGRHLHAWDTATGDLRLDSDAAPGRSEAVAASADGRYVAWGTEYHTRNQKKYPTVWIWDIDQGDKIRPLEAITVSVQTLAFTPDGNALLAGSGWHGDAILLATDGSGVLAILKGRDDDILEDVAVTPDGHYAIAGTGDGMLLIWDISDLYLTGTATPEASAASPIDKGGKKLEGVILTGALYLRYGKYEKGWQSMDHARELELKGEGAILPAGVNELTGKGWPQITVLVADKVHTYGDKEERIQLENSIEAKHRHHFQHNYNAGLVPLNGKDTMYLRYFDGANTVYKFFPYRNGRLTTLVLTIAGDVEHLPNQAKALARSAMVGPE